MLFRRAVRANSAGDWKEERLAAAGQRQAVLELRGVGVRFGATEVLRGVSLAVQEGERVALIGPNGAGKSTLFEVVSGGLAPARGEVWLRGQRVDGLAPQEVVRRGLARSFQRSEVFARLEVAQCLACAVLAARGLGLCGWRRLAGLVPVHERVRDLLGMLGLAEQAGVRAGELSYAQQRALELGLTVATEASVLLLDEPTAGMSASETRQFVGLIRRVSQGRTLLMVEHDMGVVFELADRVAVLVGGELLAFDRPQAVRADVRVQAAYLGQAAAPRRG